MSPVPLYSRHRYTLRFKFIVSLGSVLAFSLGVIFYWMFLQAKANTLSQLDRQAKALLQQIVITRSWVADHGGLFLLQRQGVLGNPLLPGTEIMDQKGNTYVFRNPAMITREISEYASREGLYQFRLTSLKLKNPANIPSFFEKQALLEFQEKGFEKSKEGLSSIGVEGSQPVYQRIIPLRVEQSCLECHVEQGYTVGEIRGGLSAVLPMDEAYAAIHRSRNSFLFASFSIICLVLGMVYLLLWKMVLQPVDSLKNVAERLIAGEYNVRASVKSGDELESFAQAFNKMTFRLKTGYEGAIKSLVAAMDARDPYTKGHTERVAKHSRAIGKKMGFSKTELDELELGAILHDIGKIGISDSLLNKAFALEADELNLMETHVKEGAKIINAADFLLSALPAILYHHERLDGKGYPQGISGENIPMIARIIAVADSFDAMTTDRPYRKALSAYEAVEEIEKNVETQFDPGVVSAFRNVYESKKAN